MAGVDGARLLVRALKGEGVRCVFGLAGVGIFASDFPHPDHKWPEIVEEVVALPLADAVKAKILWDNPAAFYGLA